MSWALYGYSLIIDGKMLRRNNLFIKKIKTTSIEVQCICLNYDVIWELIGREIENKVAIFQEILSKQIPFLMHQERIRKGPVINNLI